LSCQIEAVQCRVSGPAFGEGGRKRLLAQHRLAVRQARHHLSGVIGVAGSDDNRVNVIGVDKLLGGAEHTCAQLGGQRLRAVGGEVGNPADRGTPIDPVQPAGVFGARHADTDRADS
jgi:hypothetical protein